MAGNVFIGLGSNLGDRFFNIQEAIRLLNLKGCITDTISNIYETPAWGKKDQPAFLNGVIRCSFDGSPRELLNIAMKVENELGRIREEHWGPRIIDIDILTFADKEINEPDLIVPHPYISKRAFVLIPMADIEPDLKLQGMKKSISEMIAELDPDERNEINKFEEN